MSAIRRRAREALTGYLYLLPNITGFLVFTFLPVLAVFAIALFDGSFVTRVAEDGSVTVDARWVGLENFARLWGDREFWRCMWNTVVLLLAIPVQMALALALAVLLNQKLRGRIVFRTLLFLPTVASGIALFLVWRWIYNKDFGLLNAMLRSAGLFASNPPNWLGDPDLARPALMIMGVWIGMGGTNMVLYLAGLTGIDPTLYEAAEIDGAGAWAKFRHITWPSLRTTTFFIFTTNVIAGFQIFDQAYIMTEGGPFVAEADGLVWGTTSTVIYYLYTNLYTYGRVGYASAVAVALFFAILLVTLVNWRIGREALDG